MAEPGHGRHYELVTPLDKLGQPTAVQAISPDGHTVQYSEIGGNGLPGSESQEPIGVNNVHLAVRDNYGWGHFAMNPAWSILQGGSRPRDATASLETQLFFGRNDAGGTRSYALYTRRPAQAPVKVSIELTNRTGTTVSDQVIPQFRGASANLDHVVISVLGGSAPANEWAFLPTDPPPWPSGRSSAKLYESVAVNPPLLRRVDLDEADAPIDPPDGCGGAADRQAELGSVGERERAISADGRLIFFSVAPDCATRRLFARIDGTHTVPISASECDRQPDPDAVPPVVACASRSGDDVYSSAAADGRVVFFVTPNQLVDEDIDGTPDLYRYDFDAPTGQRLTSLSHHVGAVADVRRVVRTSDDGRRIYFVARGVLTTDPNGQQQTAAAGANNLYLYDAQVDGVRFVGTLHASGDAALLGSSRPAQLADETGRYLVFASVARLTADDVDNVRDVYRYDAVSGTLLRISTARAAFGSNGNAAFAASIMSVDFGANQANVRSAMSTVRNVSADGRRVVFSTAEALQEGDTNGVADVYEWLDGDVAMISDGQDPAGVGDPSPPGLSAQKFLISADGSAVAFSTGRGLLPARDDDTVPDVYVARDGSDVDPLEPPPAEPCVGDVCQGAMPVPSSVLPPPGSAQLLGAGNELPPVAPSTRPVAVGVRALPSRGSHARMTVSVPGAGRIVVTGSRVRRTTRVASRAGSYRVTVALSSRARRTLRTKRVLRVPLRVAYRSPQGRATKTLRVVMKSRRGSMAKGGR